MHRVNIKPLSVNEAWRGRRFKTPKHSTFAIAMHVMLPANIEIPEGKLQIQFVFGLSTERADYDNCIKQAQDIICAKYGFDDSRIYRAVIDKVIVPKGGEYIAFQIEQLAA